MLLLKFRHARKNAFTLLETVTAVGMVGLFIGILIVISSNVLGMLRTSKDNISASQNLQQRVEQLRIASWGKVWNGQLMASGILSAATPSVAGLSEPVETVIVSPYPPKSGFTPTHVVRQNGLPTVISNNNALKDERLVRVDVTLSWKGFPRKRNRTRTASILMANKGDEN